MIVTVCRRNVHREAAVRTSLLVASLIALAGCSSTNEPASNGEPVGSTGGASLDGRRPFPADNPWHADVSAAAIDPRSSTLIASCALRTLQPPFGTTWNGAPNGIPYIVVRAGQPKVPVSFYYADESDAGPYPIPANAPIEGGASSSGDRHVLIV